MTTFRKTLVESLKRIIGANGFDDVYAQFEFVDGKTEVLSELSDYYTNEMLDSAPFRAQFRPNEIVAIKSLIRIADLAIDNRAGWDELKSGAQSLLDVLTEPS